MTKREQLQAEIIEKQKEIDKAKDVVIEHYKNCMRKLTLYSPETIGYQEGVIKNIKSELSALTTALEKEGEEKEIIPLEIKKGMKLIATDPCIMRGSGVQSLTVGKIYEVIDVISTDFCNTR
jgi:hypothetical protein